MAAGSLDKALEIVSVLINSGEIKKNGVNAGLYEEYELGSDVYDNVNHILKSFNIDIYEYNNALYVTAGEGNKTFGYTNEELRKEFNVKLNRELYLCYFIIYTIMTKFYVNGNPNGIGSTFISYVKNDEIITAVDSLLSGIVKDLEVLSLDEIEEGSFKEIALVWEDMPMVISEENMLRAGRSTKTGFVKLVFNFLVKEELLMESEGKYYPKDRFKALMENYYNKYRGRLYEIINGGC